MKKLSAILVAAVVGLALAVPSFGQVTIQFPNGAPASGQTLTANGTSGQLAWTNPPQGGGRNLLDNGGFNVAQRGTTAVSSINTTATYLWDRWAGYANTGAASVTLTNVTSSLPTGYQNAAQVQRLAANASLQPIFLVQEIPSVDVIQAQGQPVCVSASLIAGSNYSAASSVITVQVITGTGTDQGLASLLSASWTGQATTLNNSAQVITTSWVRYTPAAWCFTMPASATEAAVQFGFTPVGTAGANDFFQITGAQFEIGASASPFEFRAFGQELAKVQRTFFQLTEANAFFPFAAQCTATNVITASMPLPVQMRTAPTGAVTAGGFQVVIAGAAAAAVTTLAAGTNTVNTLTVTTANTCTAGNAVSVRGSGTTGKITASADF